MKVKELIKKLRTLPQESEVGISIDVSEDEDGEDSGRRAFACCDEYHGWQGTDDEITFLFSGRVNF